MSLPIVRDTGLDNVDGRIDPAAVPVDSNGCPRCDDYPDFPARHCGKPACRDAQAIAWAHATGRDPAAVLAALAEDARLPGGLCGGCRRATACTVGVEVLANAETVRARVTSCGDYAPA